jgi:hypothetical protein
MPVRYKNYIRNLEIIDVCRQNNDFQDRDLQFKNFALCRLVDRF